jgi:hypothetical protein
MPMRLELQCNEFSFTHWSIRITVGEVMCIKGGAIFRPYGAQNRAVTKPHAFIDYEQPQSPRRNVLLLHAVEVVLWSIDHRFEETWWES